MVTGFLKDWIEMFVGTSTIDFRIGEYSYSISMLEEILFCLILFCCLVIYNFWVYMLKGSIFK